MFDLDGTLVDNLELALASAREGVSALAAERGLAIPAPSSETVAEAIGLPADAYFASLLPGPLRGMADILADRVEALEARRVRAREGRAFPGVAAIVDGLVEAGVPVAVVSNCRRRYLQANVETWFSHVPWLATRCLDDRPSKAENLAEVLVEAGSEVDPRRVAMVGDRGSDLEAARACGTRFVACRYGYGSPDELEGADRAVDSPDALAEALASLS